MTTLGRLFDPGHRPGWWEVGVECPRCRHDNRPGAKFCEECAAALARTCAKCGAAGSATAKFCSECAHPLAEPGATQPRFSGDDVKAREHLATATTMYREKDMGFWLEQAKAEMSVVAR
jgi:hypothetical protein